MFAVGTEIQGEGGDRLVFRAHKEARDEVSAIATQIGLAVTAVLADASADDDAQRVRNDLGVLQFEVGAVLVLVLVCVAASGLRRVCTELPNCAKCCEQELIVLRRAACGHFPLHYCECIRRVGREQSF